MTHGATGTITLTGLRVRGFHGVFDHERRDGQEFLVDAELSVDTAAAAAGDDLARTAHYGELAERLAAVVAGEPVDLLETLAERLAAACLVDPAVLATRVTVHKPSAPIPLAFADVAVSVRRARMQSAPDAGARDAVIAMGSNLGDRLARLQQGLDLLAVHPQLMVRAVSPVVETDPVGGVEQGSFLNAVALVSTDLAPLGLLGLLHVVEAAADRVREQRWGPRTLDLDLIVMGDLEVSGRVELPHPRAGQRAFVLGPWSEVDPYATLQGRAVSDWLLAAPDLAGLHPRPDLLLKVP